MSNSKENDVFEDAKNLVGCSYISNTLLQIYTGA